jgi:hypothetical protein
MPRYLRSFNSVLIFVIIDGEERKAHRWVMKARIPYEIVSYRNIFRRQISTYHDAGLNLLSPLSLSDCVVDIHEVKAEDIRRTL